MNQEATQTEKNPGVERPPSANVRSESVHRQLTLNSLSNLIRYVAAVGIAFFMTPFIVRTLGTAPYGFWVLVLSVVGYANILELGVQPAVVKFVGQLKATADYRSLNETISAAFLFFLGAGIVGSVAFSLVLPSFLRKVSGNMPDISYVAVIVSLIAVDVLLMFLNQLYSGILYGWQLYVGKNFIDVTALSINALMIALFLKRGGLLTLAISKTGVDLLVLLITLILCKRKLPQMELRFREVKRSSFAQLFGFGSRIFISATTRRVANYTQPMIITAFHSSTATTFYAIPSTLIDYVRQIIWALATGFMPMFSQLNSRNEKALLRSIYVNYSRYIILFVLPVIVLVFIYGAPFLTIWIGPTLAREGRWVLILLNLSLLLESFQPLVWRLFIGVAKLNYFIAISTISSILLIILSIAGIKPFGVNGVAFSFLASTLLSQIFFVPYVCKFLEMSIPSMVRQILLPALSAAFPTYCFGMLILHFMGGDSYLHLMLGSAIILLFYIAAAYLVSLKTAERAWITKQVSLRMANIIG